MQQFVGVLLLASVSCAWDGSRSGVAYSCPDEHCPAGQQCVAGVCEPVGSEAWCTGVTRFAEEFQADLDPARWEVMSENGAVAHAVDGRLAIDYQAADASAEVSMIDRVPHDDA